MRLRLRVAVAGCGQPNKIMPFVPSLQRKQVAPECPCGKSNRDNKFNPFADGSGGGVCHSCGVTFPGTKPDVHRRPDPWQPKRPVSVAVVERSAPKTVDLSTLNQSLSYGKGNTLFRFVRALFGRTLADAAWERYRVGGLDSDSTVATFWYIDKSGRPRTAKRISYPDAATGKRDKSSTPIFLYKSSDGYTVPLFGEHQMFKHQTATVLLVESEKTAIICSLWDELCGRHDRIWLATGGANGLTDEKAKALKGRQVQLAFDADNAGKAGTDKAIEVLKRNGVRPQPLPYSKQDPKDDPADGIVRKLTRFRLEQLAAVGLTDSNRQCLEDERPDKLEFLFSAGLVEYDDLVPGLVARTELCNSMFPDPAIVPTVPPTDPMCVT